MQWESIKDLRTCCHCSIACLLESWIAAQVGGLMTLNPIGEIRSLSLSGPFIVSSHKSVHCSTAFWLLLQPDMVYRLLFVYCVCVSWDMPKVNCQICIDPVASFLPNRRINNCWHEENGFLIRFIGGGARTEVIDGWRMAILKSSFATVVGGLLRSSSVWCKAL